MTKKEFAELTNGKILYLDGATGSNLYKAGMPRGVSTEQWVLEHPSVLQKLQRDYVEAGSQIVYAPTFAANALNLEFFDLEKENGFFDMADSLVETLGLDETNELNLIITKILQEDLTDSVVFLTGVGKCHPIIASHNILNNLHQVLDSVPVVMFYPGEYSGQDLKLFGTMDSRNYYRAFQLV